MSTNAQIIWLFAIVEPADPLTIPLPPLSVETRQKHGPAVVAATTRVAGRQVHAHFQQSFMNSVTRWRTL
jgi:hypothetical protein